MMMMMHIIARYKFLLSISILSAKIFKLSFIDIVLMIIIINNFCSSLLDIFVAFPKKAIIFILYERNVQVLYEINKEYFIGTAL